MTRTNAADRSFVRAMVASAEELRRHLTTELTGVTDALLCEARESIRVALSRDVSTEEAADILSQAIACATPIIASQTDAAERAIPWLLSQLAPWEQIALVAALQALGCHSLVLGTEYSVPSTSSAAAIAAPLLARLSVLPRLSLSHSPTLPLSSSHLYEPFLHHHARQRKNRTGVFFTPQPIADCIVAEADRMLREECWLDEGLASSSAQIIDPAVGTGVFLLSVIESVHRSLIEQWQRAGYGAVDRERHWNDSVPTLLERLWGIEILPAAAFLCKLNIAFKLADTGYRFYEPATINILLGNALDPALQSKIQNRGTHESGSSKIPVLLGNPPFSSLSTNTNDWIAGLVRGDGEIRGYVRANGQRLNERKTWLHDDYVKFIRLAQWHVEEGGCGIVGFVTNHGYLDNVTFRLMRQELLRVFPVMRFVDLHGNRKKHEVSPDGNRDENIFGLDQGVAIGLFCRPPIPTRSVNEGAHRVEFAELWGTRNSKLEALPSASLAHRVSVLEPQPPEWRFVPTVASSSHPEYESAWSLADAMPVNTTAPVTARDHFVVAFTVDELRQRIADFRDLSISDDAIRRRYFTRTRSARYQLGDTRGWKLSTARQIVAADKDGERHIVRCLYRPFDWRFVFWHPAMIDWPRTEVTRHLIPPLAPSPQPPAPLCLIARRQQLPSQPCTFFWIADGLALDGVIRSDNRGSESLFPLYVQQEVRPGELRWAPNFAPAFVKDVQARIGRPADPESLLAYIYALFHAASYRKCYADELRTGFPRVLLPRSGVCFDELSELGRQLIDCHLLHETPAEREEDLRSLQPAVENFRAGGYVAIRKWLQPKHRSRQDPPFRRVVAAINHTQELMARIDRIIVTGSSHVLGDPATA